MRLPNREQLRYYVAVAISPRGRHIGAEVKSGTARKSVRQREFDSSVSGRNPARGVGNSSNIHARRTIEIRR